MTRSVRYQPILHTLYYTLHTEHAYCLSNRYLNKVAVIEMVEMVEILDGRLGQLSVERVRYVINNLLHLVIVKYGDISLVLCISTRLRLVTILSQLVKYLVIFHADPCNKSYISGSYLGGGGGGGGGGNQGIFPPQKEMFPPKPFQSKQKSLF